MPLMLFQVISIQPSERWMWALRDSSKGSAIAAHVPSDAQGS
jgi:hypothetical protein